VNTGKRKLVDDGTTEMHAKADLNIIDGRRLEQPACSTIYVVFHDIEVEIHVICVMYKVLDSIHDESRRK
jgi:hypothetical protein